MHGTRSDPSALVVCCTCSEDMYPTNGCCACPSRHGWKLKPRCILFRNTHDGSQVSNESFERAMGASGIHLKPEELALLKLRYQVPGLRGVVNYQRFCDQIDKVRRRLECPQAGGAIWSDGINSASPLYGSCGSMRSDGKVDRYRSPPRKNANVTNVYGRLRSGWRHDVTLTNIFGSIEQETGQRVLNRIISPRGSICRHRLVLACLSILHGARLRRKLHV